MARKARQTQTETTDRPQGSVDPEKLRAVNPWYWALHGQIRLQGGLFAHKHHEYLAEPLRCYHPNQCTKKAAQMGFTEKSVIRTLHGMIKGRIKIGALHLFPTQDDVADFSKARFNPLIADNPEEIGAYVRNTDATNIKRIGNAMLYLRGGRPTRSEQGLKDTSSKLKSIPVDRLVIDERDEIPDTMVDLALERLSHSEVKEVERLSTPMIPDSGIDLDYKNSDQRMWVIRCQHCGTDNILELEFPTYLMRTLDGRVLRTCKKCRGEIFPHDGRWIAQVPSQKDMVGWWIGQHNSYYIDPKSILDIFERLGQPGVMSTQEFYNSKLGLAYVDGSQKLQKSDLYQRVGQEPMLSAHRGPTAMGVDVGNFLHTTIWYWPKEGLRRLAWCGRLKEWNDVHDVAMRFNVSTAVIDMEPELHKAREFQKAEPYAVFLCDYNDNQSGSAKWDLEKGTIQINRTEYLDNVHSTVTTPGKLEIPRLCSEVEEYVDEMTNMVKVLVTKTSGDKFYTYKATGADHYRHSTVYGLLALEKCDVAKDDFSTRRPSPKDRQETDYDIFAGGIPAHQSQYPQGGVNIFGG